jgi:integrase
MKVASLAKFRREVLDLYTPPMRSRRTYAKMRRTLAILASIRAVKSTADFTASTVAKFCRKLEPLNRNTVRGYLQYLRAAFSYAESVGYVKSSPFRFRRVWVRGKRPAAKRFHERAAISKVLRHLEANNKDFEGQLLYTLAALVVHTGIRRDEALLAQRRDLDLKTRIFEIWDRDPLKTERSATPVPFPASLVPILKSWLKRIGRSRWLFPNRRRTGPWTGGAYGDRPPEKIRDAAKKVGVKGFTLLSLRHSLATHLEDEGCSDLQIQRILRHSNRHTQTHYRHAQKIAMAKWVESLDFQRPKKVRRKV